MNDRRRARVERLRRSARRVAGMVRKEWLQLFRDPRTKRIIFLSPVLQLVLFGYAVNTDVRRVATFVVDHDRTERSRALVDAFTAGGWFRIVGRSQRPADLARALDAGDAVVGLQVPAGFARDLAAGRSPAVQILVDGTNSNTATVAQGYALRIVGAFAEDAAREVRRRAVSAAMSPAAASSPDATGADMAQATGRASSPASPAPDAPAGGGFTSSSDPAASAAADPAATATSVGAPLPPAGSPDGVDLRARAWFNPSLASRVYNIPAVIGVILLLMCLLLTSLAVVRERELGTLEQLLVSPLTPSELMLGKTIPVAGVALIQLTLVVAVALLWFRIPLRGPVPDLLLAALLFILAGLAFGLLISTLASTQQEAFLSMFLFVLPAIILSGFLYPIETMPPFFQWLTLLNPLRHFLDVVRSVFLKGTGVAELWPSYLVLAATAAVVLMVATRRFRRSVE